MKRPIVVASYGAEVSKRANRLLVSVNGRNKPVPLGVIELLILFPGVSITSSAIRFLSHHNRPVIFVNGFGKVVSVSLPEHFGSSTVSLRAAQYRLFPEEAFANALIRELLLKKCNQLKEVIPDISEKITEVEEKIPVADTLNTLLGLDGTLGKLMYGYYSQKDLGEFSFKSREYYPPPDPVNAVLSLAFSYFYNLITANIIGSGFDPYMGFFHRRRGTHASLASDVIEIVRPKIANFVFELFETKIFKKEDFEETIRGITLREDKLKFLLLLLTEFQRKKKVLNTANSFIKKLKEKLV